DIPGAHRGEDSAAIRRDDGVRSRRVALRVRLLEPAVRRATYGIREIRSQRLREDTHPARGQERATPGVARCRPCERLSGGLGTVPPGQAQIPWSEGVPGVRPGRDSALHRLV